MKEFIISYAQNREDVLLEAFFPNVNDGFYVDVGANHPEVDSVTKLFYLKGWHGINIEPVSKLFRLLEQERPKDINVNMGISNRAGKLRIREYEAFGVGLSTFSEYAKKANSKNKVPYTHNFKDYEIPVTTLSNLFKKYNIKKINFLKIDVEGYEGEVLEGNDWGKYRPQIICIESNHINKDWRPMLKRNKYRKVFFDGLNEYYVAEEHRKIAESFSYVEGIIGRPIIPLGFSREVTRQNTINKKLEVDRQSLESRIHELEKYNFFIKQQIEDQNQIRKQAIALLRGIDIAVKKRIFKIDKTKTKTMHRNTASLNLPGENASKEELLKVAQNYDLETFYTKHNIHVPSVRHFMFVLILQFYNFFRIASLSTIRFGLKIIKKLGKGN